MRSIRSRSVVAGLTIAVLVMLQLQLSAHFSISESSVATAHASSYDNLPLAFEPNHGQAGDEVQFVVHHGQSITGFTKNGATTSIGPGTVTMSLVGANEQSYVGQNELESKTNYFIGNDPSKWQSDIPNYQSLLAQDVYPGIDLTYYGTNSQLEHDFIVAPGADYTQIAFTFAGQDNLHLDDNGNLVVTLGEEVLTLQAPKTYQERPGSIQTIPSSFTLANDTVRFELHGEYDTTLRLIIDPVLIYSTYLGGSGEDRGYQIKVDASGNAYVGGYTTSTNFPTASPYQGANAGGYDAFITKLNAAGSALVYSTYLGGSGTDSVYAMTLNGSGETFLTGFTDSTNFPTSSPFQATAGGNGDAFIAKFSATGSALLYSTYLGGSGTDFGNSIALDSVNNVYLTGSTVSIADFPTNAPYQASNAGGQDAFATELNAAGSALVYSTYLGGSGTDVGTSIAVDAAGSAYLTGYTNSTNFPASSPFQASNGGGYDAYITKLNVNGSALSYSTYLGGAADDLGRSIIVDDVGNAYLAGSAASTNFPTSSPYQAANAGNGDAFVTKLNAAGSALAYSTYLGGGGDDGAYAIVVGTAGNVYLTGYTSSTNFPISSPYQATNAGGSYDAYVTKLNITGSSLVYSTYLGGGGTDVGRGISVSLSGNAYVTGSISSTNFPTTSPFQISNAGGVTDAFITQLSENSVTLSAQVNPTLTFDLSSNSCALGTLSVSQTQFCTYTVTAATNGTNGYTISYLPAATLTSGADTISHLSSQTASLLGTEQFGFNLRANTAAGSFTATDFGADPSGGAGTVASTYNTANQFKFSTSGDTIATTTGPSVNTIFTIGTIANITSNTEAGAYTTTLTYNIVSTY